MKGKYKGFIIILSIPVLLLLFLIFYLIYDRMIIPPPPTWTSPPFTPDNIKAPWIRNPDGGAGYYLDFVEKNKKNNAFVHYLNAFTMLTIPSRDEEALIAQMTMIFEEGWTQNFPLVEETLQLNKNTLNEIHQGADMQNCLMPPSPHTMQNPPFINWEIVKGISDLLITKGRFLEQQNKKQDALQCYLDGLKFGQCFTQRDQCSLHHMLGIAVIGSQSNQLQRFLKEEILKEVDYRQIIKITTEVDSEITPFTDILLIEQRTMRNEIAYILSTSTNIYYMAQQYLSKNNTVSTNKLKVYFHYLNAYFNKGHILRDYDQITNYIRDYLKTRTYREVMDFDWKSKIPSDFLNKMLILNFPKSYHQQILQYSNLRLIELQSAIYIYHFQKKEWPKGLEDLKEYLDPIPIDPFTGKSFLWSKDSAGRPFVYSPGPDNKDNQAKYSYNPTNGTISEGDIVPF